MAWAGHYAGQWPGAWFGPLETAPGAIYGSAAIRFVASGALGQGGLVANISGSATINFSAYGLVVIAADRFAWARVLSGPPGYSNALLGRMALRTRRRR